VTARAFSLVAAIALVAPALASRQARAAERGEAIFAGGCFWCMETAFEGQPGVKEVISGYDGGGKKNPKYEEVGSGGTGHAESVRVVYDPSKTSYAKLLDLFWHNIDPFAVNAQFCDHGPQYRSAIFYLDEAQKKAAEESQRAVEAQLKRKVATEIAPATPFYPAEDYHQDFYKKNPTRYYSYREGCGRDRRLQEVWGAAAGHSAVH
jgi:peptide-methionine (S)-S-oxide reductase